MYQYKNAEQKITNLLTKFRPQHFNKKSIDIMILRIPIQNLYSMYTYI